MRGRWGGWGLPGLALLTGLLLAAFPAQSQYIASYNSLQQNGSSVSGYLATDLAGFVWCPEEYSDYGEEGCVYYYDAIVFGQLLLNSGVVDSSSEVYEYDMLSEAYLYAEVPSGDNYFQLSATHGVEYCLGPWSWTWRTQWGFSNEFLTTHGPGSPPVITGIDPSNWQAGSSLYVTITGSGFGSGSAPGVYAGTDVSISVYNWSDTEIDTYVTVAPGATPGSRNVVVSPDNWGGQGFTSSPPSGSQQTSGTVQIHVAPQVSVTLSPEILYVSTGDTDKYIYTNVSPSNVQFTAVYSSSADPTQPSGGRCNASLTIPNGSGTGSASSQVTASPAGCSSVINVIAAAAGGASQNSTRVVVPPQKLIQMLNGEASGQTASGDMSQLSIGVIARNRFGDSYFGGYSTYDDVISHGFAPSGIVYGHDPELPNAAKVYANDASTVNIVEDAKCFWSPKLTQWSIVQGALQSPTTEFPTGTGASGCWTASERQILYKTSIGLSTRGGEYAGAPAFLFLRKRNANEPAVRQIN